MKIFKHCLLILILITFFTVSKAQRDISLSYKQMSPYLVGSGVTISVFAYVISPEQTVDYHNFQGYSQTPIYKQDVKFYSLLSGVGITITGLVGLCVRK